MLGVVRVFDKTELGHMIIGGVVVSIMESIIERSKLRNEGWLMFCHESVFGIRGYR